MQTNLFQQELNQQVPGPDDDAVYIEQLSLQEINKYIDNEINNLKIKSDDFEQKKTNRKFKAADKIKKEYEIIEAVIEKLKYQKEKMICKKHYNKSESKFSTIIDTMKTELDAEVNVATNEQKQDLELQVNQIEKEQEVLKIDISERLNSEKFTSQKLLILNKEMEKLYNKNDMKGCEKLDIEIKKVEIEDQKINDRQNKKKLNEILNNRKMEDKKKIEKFMRQRESQLNCIQKKWMDKIETEKKKQAHDNVMVNLDNDKRMADARITLELKNPKYANKLNLQTSSKLL